MNTQQIFEIVQYVVCGLAVLFSIVQLIYNKVKGSNSRFLSKSLDFIKEISTTLGFAEQMTKLQGAEKKEFAKNTIAMYCENKHIKISDEQLNIAIEILIELTKKVNAREKDLIGASDGLVGDIEADNTLLAGVETDSENGELI